MVTQFHTLLHFVTLFPPVLPLSACVAASIRIMGVSKSHLLVIISDYAEHLCVQTHMYAYRVIHCSGAYSHYVTQDSYCMGVLAQ